MNTEKIFNQLYKEAKNDTNVIGFFLGGSRGLGLGSRFSDYDILMIVKDDKLEISKKKYATLKHGGIDLGICSFSKFESYASWGSPEEWDRYSFAHCKVLIDKNEKIQELVNEKARIPENKITPFIKKALDGYINYVYRSLKCHRDDNLVGARLEAAYSIPFFLDTIFAIHNGRLRPYYKYLKWELETYPLEKFPMDSKDIIVSIMKIMDQADIKTQQKLLNVIEKVFRHEGYGTVFDGWGKDLHWMMSYRK